jgi:hypothetical protein
MAMAMAMACFRLTLPPTDFAYEWRECPTNRVGSGQLVADLRRYAVAADVLPVDGPANVPSGGDQTVNLA